MQTFASPSEASPTVPPRKRRKSKNHKNDLLPLDPTDSAEQLALLEYKLYVKLTAQECISYAKTQAGKTVENLTTFCSTHDKLAAWVKTSILTNEALGKRADTVDFWIKVAEVRLRRDDSPIVSLTEFVPSCPIEMPESK